MILQKNSNGLSRSTARDVAVVLRDVADADRGVDDDRPDRGDEDHEDRRGLASRKAASEIGSQASGGTVRSTWKIGSSPRIAHTRLADERAERDADDGRRGRSRWRRAAARSARASRARCPAGRRRRTDRRSGRAPRSRSWSATAAWRSGLLHSSCQTIRSSASMTSGGSTRAAIVGQRRQHARLRASSAWAAAAGTHRRRRTRGTACDGLGLANGHVHAEVSVANRRAPAADAAAGSRALRRPRA